MSAVPAGAAGGAGGAPPDAPPPLQYLHSNHSGRTGTGTGTGTGGAQLASEERVPSSSRLLRPRTTAGWSASAANHRTGRGRQGGPGTTHGAASAQPSHNPAANPGSAPTSSLIAVMLVAKSARGSHVVFQWPPKPHLLRRLSQVRYYNDPDRQHASHRNRARARSGAQDEDLQRTSYAFDRQHNAPAEHPKASFVAPTFSRRYRANHDSSSSASDSVSGDSTQSSDLEDEAWSSAGETGSYASVYDADDDDGSAHDPNFTEGEESAASVIESADSDGHSVSRFRSRAGSVAPSSRLRPNTSMTPDLANHPQRRTQRATSANMGQRSLSRTRAALLDSNRSTERISFIDTMDQRNLNPNYSGHGPSSPQRSIISDTPSEAARKRRAWDTYLGYENSFLAELLTPSRGLCHRKFELAVDDLVFVGHPVCADDNDGWVLNSPRWNGAPDASDAEHDVDLMSRGRAPRSDRYPVSNFPNATFAAGERSPFDPSPRSSSFPHLQHLPAMSRSQVRAEHLNTPVSTSQTQNSHSLSSFHFVLVLDKPDPAPPYLPPGMASIIPASQLNAFDIDPNLSAQLYYDNIAFKMTAALYNEECTCGFVSQQVEYLEQKREASRRGKGRFVKFMNQMRKRDGSLAKAMADLFESLSKNEGALITINNRIETHLQLPPILRETRRMLFSSDLETERDLLEGQRGMASFEEQGAYYDTTTNSARYNLPQTLDPEALQYEEWKRTTGPQLVPWKTLLMLKNHKAEPATALRRKGDADRPTSSRQSQQYQNHQHQHQQHRRGESHGSLMSRFASIGMSTASGSGGSGSRQSPAAMARLDAFPFRSTAAGGGAAATTTLFGQTYPGLLLGGSGGGGGAAAPESADMSMQNSAGSGLESRRLSSTASADEDREGDDEGATGRLLSSFAIEEDGHFAGQDDVDALEARGIEAWIPRFAAELEPKLDGIPTLKELAVNLNWDLYQDVYPMVRHLIYYREARVIDVPFISNIYSISPLVDTANLGRLSKDWEAAFPALPKLVRVLSQLSSSARPYEKQLDSAAALSHPPSPALDLTLNARQELYLDALFWLLRAELLVQLQFRHRILATQELKEQAHGRHVQQRKRRKERREARMRAREDARARRAMEKAAQRLEAHDDAAPAGVGAGGAAGLFEPASHRSGVSAAQQRIADELAQLDPHQRQRGLGESLSPPPLSAFSPSAATASSPHLGDFDDRGHDNDDLDDEDDEEGNISSDGEDWEWQDHDLGPSLIAEPGAPSKEEEFYLEIMMEELPGDLAAVFREALPFFNGKHSLEEIVSRRDLSFDKLRSLMRKRGEYFIAFLHP